jgi:hypothetical protein
MPDSVSRLAINAQSPLVFERSGLFIAKNQDKTNYINYLFDLIHCHRTVIELS